MRWCSTSIRSDTMPIAQIGIANCNDQIAARAFGAVEHVRASDFNLLRSYDAVFATMWKVMTPEIESRWMDVLHRLKDETNCKVVLFQEAETPWPTTRSWEEQKSFIELLGKVDLFLTHNERDISMWGPLRNERPTWRWRTCLDVGMVRGFTLEPALKSRRPIIFGSSYDQRANGLAGLIACKDLGYPLWHQNRSTGYADRNAELPGLLGLSVDKEIPHSNWGNWLTECAGAYLAVHPMPAASAGRDQICFAAMGIPCVGNGDLDIQMELFPRLAVECFDVAKIHNTVMRLLEDDSEYDHVRRYAMSRIDQYSLSSAIQQALRIKMSSGLCDRA